MDNIKNHYLNKQSLLQTPAYILEHRENMDQLKANLELEFDFVDDLSKQGLLNTYIKTKVKTS